MLAQEMYELSGKRVLVVGLGVSGCAACGLLRHRGARVSAVDAADSESLRRAARELGRLGVNVHLGQTTGLEEHFDLAVVSPGVPGTNPLVGDLHRRGIPVVGELELGFQQSLCLNVAITGTNGKTTTTELVTRLLTHAGRKTLAAGNIGTPLCAVADQTRDLDFLTLEVSSFQLETIQYFRPAVAVLLNITPDHLDRYDGLETYARAKARIFANQQAFDWAIIQSDALRRLRSLNLPIPSKIITFSATDPGADLQSDRGLLVSRLPDWSGPLLNMDQCRLCGPHNAENLMAALAVGRVLRIPLDPMVQALTSYVPAPNRCELVAEIAGVKYFNDSKATNPDAVHKALQAMPSTRSGEPNVWLIAGGRDKGLEYHDLGPVLTRRVKRAFLIGEAAEKIRAAWSLFTPCTLAKSLVEAVSEAARCAATGDVVLLSPACSSFDMFHDYAHRGEVFREAVSGLARATGGRTANAHPTHRGGGTDSHNLRDVTPG